RSVSPRMRAASARCAASGSPPIAASNVATPWRARASANSSVKVHTPPTVSPVMRTRLSCGSGTLVSVRFQLHQRRRTLFLNVAEFVKSGKIGLVRPLPCVLVRRSPSPRVVGRPGIGKQRNRLVRPNAVRVQVFAPCLDLGGIVVHGIQQVRLHKGNAL